MLNPVRNFDVSSSRDMAFAHFLSAILQLGLNYRPRGTIEPPQLLYDPGELSQDCLAVMVERHPLRPRWWDIALPPHHPALPVRFRFTVSDVTVPGTDFVIATEDDKYMEVAGQSSANVTFWCDAETFVLVGYGRKTPQSAISNGSLFYQGDGEWADIFVRSFIGG